MRGAQSRLIFYDTTDYTGFPIGGQLTSVRNFLRYLCEEHPERCGEILLVGVSTDPSAVGRFAALPMYGRTLRFLPVAAAETDLSHTAHSLRLAFARGLLRYGRRLALRRGDCQYIQTPEAAGPVRLLCPGARYVIFSHGSYANMDRGLRFFRRNVLLRRAFRHYLRGVVRRASLIFVLDESSRWDYLPYNRKLVSVRNSIVLPEQYSCAQPGERVYGGRLLFVGRLSKDKGVDGILRAVRLLEQEGGGETLTIVGDGEEGDRLRGMEESQGCRVRFAGAVTPAEVQDYMEASDILVMNSRFEGVPMTILEALSHGLPVISTAVGGIAETVRFGVEAEETDGSPEGIARAVRRIREHYGDYAAAAHRRAADYDYRRVNRALYEALAAFWPEG